MSDSIQDIRDKYIIELEKSDGMLRESDNFSNDLFNLDLTVYSDNYTFDSIIYNAFAAVELKAIELKLTHIG